MDPRQSPNLESNRMDACFRGKRPFKVPNFSKFVISVFRHFFGRQASYEAETLTTDRSRARRHFVRRMFGASAAKKTKNQKTIANFLRKFSRVRAVTC